MSSIPASEFVNVIPSVIGAGGNAIDINGLMLTDGTRIPIGTVPSFSSAAAVSDFFGAGSAEAQAAAIYFLGFNGRTTIPGALLMAQYPGDAVAAYLRSGDVSSLTLAQIQAIAGTLTVNVDGYPRVAGSLNLSASTSFTSAAGIIQTALNAGDPNEAAFTASIGAAFTGSQTGTNLTTTSVTGLISVGDTVTGTGVAADTTIVSQTSGTPGGAGVYVTSVSGTASSASCVATSNVLDVTVLASGALAVGQTINGSGVTAAVITALGTGTVGVGTYVISGAPQHVVSEAMTSEGTPVIVTYDSVSGGFIVTSGITGVPSTIAFATGSTAAALKLTSATGAVVSQGAAAAVPATFMAGIVTNTLNWVTFMTLFDPDGGDGNTVKEAFAAWTSLQNDRFAYICWDPDLTPTLSVPASSSLGQILAADGSSGTCLIWGPDNTKAAFVCGAAASINFDEVNGRIDFAYKGQNGLVADVTDGQVSINLGGNPQTSDRGNGYNYYGFVGTAFLWFQRGFVTGDFLWLDSYINQVWLNNLFQVALLTFLNNSKSVPYTTAGYAAIAQAMAPAIANGLSFGAFAPGPIDAAQAAEVNTQAGRRISDTLQAEGYYLQILPASSSARAARTSPPMKFWYLDRGSVQAISLSSIAVQ